MTTRHPPRLAMWLLHRAWPADEALVGDLVEEFARRRSRVWFWRQALGAVILYRKPAVEPRPLGLLDGEAAAPSAPPLARDINLTASPIYGVGGLGLVVLAVMVVMSPGSWLIALAILLNGLVLGGVLAYVRHRRARRSRPPSLLVRK